MISDLTHREIQPNEPAIDLVLADLQFRPESNQALAYRASTVNEKTAYRLILSQATRVEGTVGVVPVFGHAGDSPDLSQLYIIRHVGTLQVDIPGGETDKAQLIVRRMIQDSESQGSGHQPAAAILDTPMIFTVSGDRDLRAVVGEALEHLKATPSPDNSPNRQAVNQVQDSTTISPANLLQALKAVANFDVGACLRRFGQSVFAPHNRN